MTFSVNTNVGAMIALQNLASTQSQLETVQNQINTGLKVSSAKDDASTWAIAQNQRAQVMSLDSVVSSLSRSSSSVDVAISAGTSISDLLVQMIGFLHFVPAPGGHSGAHGNGRDPDPAAGNRPRRNPWAEPPADLAPTA